MVKAFLFDMDGVLFDSMKHHAEAWYKVMGERYGFTCDRSEFYLYEGSTGGQTIDAFFVEQKGRHATDDEWRQIYKEKSDVFASFGEALPMAGAADVLRKVGEMGLTRVLVTGSGQASLIGRLDKAYPGVFDDAHMVTGNDCPIGKGKPHPYPYLKGLEKAGNISPEEALVVENAPLGVRAAKTAGIFTVAVNTGPLDPQVLKDAGADIVLGSMSELAEKVVAIASSHRDTDTSYGH